MYLLRSIVSRVVATLRKRSLDRELEEELRFHLDMQIEQNVNRGMDAKEARREAMRSLGAIESVKESYRDLRGIPVIDALAQDLRYALRTLLRNPAFTAIGVSTLALGIGASTAIFTLVNALLLQPLPVERPDEIVGIFAGDKGYGFSGGTYDRIRGQAGAFSGVIASAGVEMHLTTRSGARLARAEAVSNNYFSELGVAPKPGRAFLADEDNVAVIVLSHGIWTQDFGEDPRILGQTVSLNGFPFTVIGIAPAGFRGTHESSQFFSTDIWLPLTMLPEADSMYRRLNDPDLKLVARLKPGVTREQARANVEQLTPRDELSGRDDYIVVSSGVSAPEDRKRLVRVSTLFMFTVALVLVIACVNVSHLLIARSLQRWKEIGIRLAIGAGRGRVIRQLLTESVLLSGIGGIGGLVLAYLMVAAFVASQPSMPVPIAVDVRPDHRVWTFAFLVSVLTGISCGLLPALQASRPSVGSALKEETLPGRYRRPHLYRFLIAGQVATCLVLLVGAGLFVQSYRSVTAIRPGFQTEDRIVASLPLLERSGYDEAQGRVFYDRLVSRVAAVPGVRSATLVNSVPLSSLNRQGWYGVNIEGVSDYVAYAVVGNDYFKTLGLPILEGRPFLEDMRRASPREVVINETMARRYWPDDNPVGQTIRLEDDGIDAEIVGVAKDNRYWLKSQPKAYMYLPLSQAYQGWMSLVAHAPRARNSILGEVRQAVAAVDPDVPIVDVRFYSDHIALTLWPESTGARLLSIFGAVGFLMSAVGLYGVVAYAVGQRFREISIRIALGARHREIVRMVLREGLMIVFAGILLGLMAAFALTHLLSSFLYEVSPTDPATFSGVVLLLTVATTMACYFPARRALRIAPTEALRYE